MSQRSLTVAVCDPAFGADRSGRVSALAPGSRHMLDALGVDAVFSDFPDTALAAFGR